MRRLFPLLLALIFVSCSSLTGNQADSPRNVVFFISDGCGPASFSLAREYQRSMSGETKLHLDEHESGSTITHPLEVRVTDSASSATAYACGIKTLNGRIAMTADTVAVETILEKAEAAGFQTALISTARITHATAAAFSSHVDSRSKESEIALQQIEQGIEILMGGGTQFYTPRESGGRRTDGRDLIAELESKGYARADDRDALMAADSLPLVALFTSSHMAYEIDRDEEMEPSLAEMTSRALSLLDKDDAPFFIMIEAGRIDHAGHGNDPAAHLWDIMAYDEAWKAAVDFAHENGETLVVGTSDHETGGLTLGAEHGGLGGSGYAYDPTKLEPIASSVEAFQSEIAARMSDGTMTMDWFRESLTSKFNIDCATIASPMTEIMAQAGSDPVTAGRRMQSLLTGVMSDSARVGWATGGHTAVNVPIYAFGPGSGAFRGTMDNTEVGMALQDVLGLR